MTTPVPYDPELEPGLAAFLDLVERIPLRADTILANRAHFATIIPPIGQIVGDRPVEVEDRTVPGPPGAPDIVLTIIRPRGGVTDAPAFYSIHGGGMVLGNRFFGVDGLIDDVLRFGAVGVSVEYRLAPENPAPAAVEDCYAGLVWLVANAAGLGVDPGRIVVTGASAGGGLSAGVALMARDLDGPSIIGQMLLCPMIDDRNESVSTRQYDGRGAWDRNNNDTGWNALLGPLRGTEQASPYAVPARAADVSNLPPAYIDVGAAEIFRDEATEYALRIWATGGQAELHVWAGGYHGFAGFSPGAEVSRAAASARLSWLRRILRAP
ncbi:alpha/beta hydrolase [Kibdelosporangium phytohabitans]|uniref:Alpha/beta hydrolase n=1 Tax=Kibdelosporangium phytohabitans TaxID=860235 RepID=A0A0N9I277_9PSEU|nr:alpha/beta hydrolase [Kibdelosporangium phytohabitans]ALG09782.1 alpha/beta hydrolase [Kibdelosporangium phytohabitans]MBE1468842.1 acetyl esterase/lipase [Kibdelosporangium phytohabitans]